MRALLLASTAILAGCTSGYQGVRLSSTGDYTGVAPETKVGVPFTLTKPEFTIKKVEGSDPARFDIGVAYVPDPEQRYALRISPTWLAKIDFNMAIGANGGLTSSSADITDQTVPFVTAVIKLVASVAKVAAASPNNDRAAGGPKCLDSGGLGAIANCAIKEAYTNQPAKCLPAAGQAIEARLKRTLIGDKEDKGAALDTLFARTAAELACFDEAQKVLSSAITDDGKVINAAYDTQGRANNGPLNPKNPLTPANILFAKTAVFLTKTVKDNDLTAARKLVYSVRLAATGDGSYLGKLLEIAAPAKADAALLEAVLVTMHFEEGTGAEPVLALVNGTKAQKALDGVARLSAGQWRARYIPVLQYELAEAERAALVAATPAEVATQQGIAAERRETLAAVVNMSAEYARLAKLDAILNAVPDFSAADKQSRVAEYQGYVKLVSDIRTEIATRLAAAVVVEKPATKEAQLPISLPWVSRTCIDESTKTAGWIFLAGTDAPDYVIVLRNAKGDIVPPAKQIMTPPGNAVVMPTSACRA